MLHTENVGITKTFVTQRVVPNKQKGLPANKRVKKNGGGEVKREHVGRHKKGSGPVIYLNLVV